MAEEALGGGWNHKGIRIYDMYIGMPLPPCYPAGVRNTDAVATAREQMARSLAKRN